MTELFIGLMSGTSTDGIDAALVDLGEAAPRVLATHYQPYDPAFRLRLREAASGVSDSLDTVAALDAELGELLARAANAVLTAASVTAGELQGIGSHGHTLRHSPEANAPVSVQIGDPNRIAALTGITTVADFRRADMAVGGQGAPLAPAFHDACLRDQHHYRAIVNVGGIANVTVLPPRADSASAIGFDTGPGNALMDEWTAQHQGQDFDRDGAWAASGQVDRELLEALCNEPYLALPPPKSTGRELFNLAWLNQRLGNHQLNAGDVQSTLCEFTARTIVDALRDVRSDVHELLLCGGGVNNGELVRRLRTRWQGPVASTDSVGVPPDFLEAIAFAWLAQRTLAGRAGNLPSVTGADRAVVLGAVYVRPVRDAR